MGLSSEYDDLRLPGMDAKTVVGGGRSRPGLGAGRGAGDELTDTDGVVVVVVVPRPASFPPLGVLERARDGFRERDLEALLMTWELSSRNMRSTRLR